MARSGSRCGRSSTGRRSSELSRYQPGLSFALRSRCVSTVMPVCAHSKWINPWFRRTNPHRISRHFVALGGGGSDRLSTTINGLAGTCCVVKLRSNVRDV